MALIDKTGTRYGGLIVSGLSHRVFRSNRHGYYNYWRCICDCGAETVVLGNNLTKGNTKSCGCQSSRNTLQQRATIHGMIDSGAYKSWCGMNDRCRQPTHASWKYYGALGISVCERWRKFENFLADMGDRPEGMSIDRIDPKGNYEPANCRWADAKTQANNQRRRNQTNE